MNKDEGKQEMPENKNVEFKNAKRRNTIHETPALWCTVLSPFFPAFHAFSFCTFHNPPLPRLP